MTNMEETDDSLRFNNIAASDREDATAIVTTKSGGPLQIGPSPNAFTILTPDPPGQANEKSNPS